MNCTLSKLTTQQAKKGGDRAGQFQAGNGMNRHLGERLENETGPRGSTSVFFKKETFSKSSKVVSPEILFIQVSLYGLNRWHLCI